MPLPDFEGWAMVAAVAAGGSFRAGAAACGVSVPTLSKAIARLEARLGMPLFHRTSRRVTLTQAGERLLGHAQEMVAAAETVEEMARDDASDLSGLVRLTAPMSLGMSCVGALISDFAASHPGVTVDLILSDARCDLVADGIDLALRIASLPDSSLRSQTIAPVPTSLLASPDWLARHAGLRHPVELDPAQLLGYGHERRDQPVRLTGPGGERFSIVPAGPLLANNGDVMLPLLISGQAVAVLPHFIAAETLQSGALVPLLPDWHIGAGALHLVSPPSRLRPARVSALAGFLVERLRGHPLLDPLGSKALGKN